MMELPRRKSLRRTYKDITRRHKHHRRRNRHTRKIHGGADSYLGYFQEKAVQLGERASQFGENFKENAAQFGKNTYNNAVNLPNDATVRTYRDKWGKIIKNTMTRAYYKILYNTKQNYVFSIIKRLTEGAILPSVNFRDVSLLGLIWSGLIQAAFIPIDNNTEFTETSSNSNINYRMQSTILNMDNLRSLFENETVPGLEEADKKIGILDRTRTLAPTLIENTRFEFILIQVNLDTKSHLGSASVSGAAIVNIVNVGYIVYKAPFKNKEIAEFQTFKSKMQVLANKCSQSLDSYKYYTNAIFGFDNHKYMKDIIHPIMMDETNGVKIYSQKACTPLFESVSPQFKTVVPLVYVNIVSTKEIESNQLRRQYNEPPFGIERDEEYLNNVVHDYLNQIEEYMMANNNFIFQPAQIKAYNAYDNYTVLSPKVIFINLLRPINVIRVKFNTRVANRVILSHLMQYLLCTGINVYLNKPQYNTDAIQNQRYIIEHMINIRKNTASETSNVNASYNDAVSSLYGRVGVLLHKLEMILDEYAFFNNANEWKMMLSSMFGLVILDPTTLLASNLDEIYKDLPIISALNNKIDMCKRFDYLIENVKIAYESTNKLAPTTSGVKDPESFLANPAIEPTLPINRFTPRARPATFN